MRSRRAGAFCAAVLTISGIAVTAATGAVAGAVADAAPAAAESTCDDFSSGSGECVGTTVTVAGTAYDATWYVPDGEAAALVVLQHGFTRNCGHLRNTSTAVMEEGLMVLCLDADMTGGNPALAADLGDVLSARALVPPLGRTLPTTYVVGGHSAGGHFAGALGARLDANGYPALAGAVLLDPVASGGFSADLLAVSDGGERPVLAVAARPNVANLFNNSFGALEALPSSYTGIQLVWSGFRFGWPYGGSCHTDAEGDNGDFIGNTAALCTPAATQYTRLREFASVWAHDLATGTQTAAYWCADENDRSTCGSAVAPLVTGSRPVAATIPA